MDRALRDVFTPEFLNRIDETIVFKPLPKDSLRTIIGLLLRGDDSDATSSLATPDVGENVRPHRRLSWEARDMKRDEQNPAKRRPVNVFISYRRGDSDTHAELLADVLKERFGERRVFFDIDQDPGEWRKNIREHIKRSDVLVSMIGKRWVELREPPEENGEPNGEDTVRWHEDDVVRWELQLALERKIELVPVFVDGVRDIPEAKKLPEELRALKRWMGYPLVPRSHGQVPYRQGLEHICNMVELAVRRRRDRDLKSRVEQLVETAREQAQEGTSESARATLERAGVAAKEIDEEVLREEALTEIESELSALASAEQEAKPAGEDRARGGAAERGDFSTAEELVGSRGTTRGHNTGATKEPGEPDHAGNAGGRSVWYRWTAPEDGTATIDTFGSDFDTLLAVYRGSSLAELELVAANDDTEGSQSRVRFPVTEGDEYRIAIDGYNGDKGAVVFNWEISEPPSNDAIAGAEELVGSRGTTRGHNTGATKEPGEPDHAGNAGGRSVWYRWTAPEDGTATIDTFGSDFDTLLAVYRGSSLAELELVAANDDTEGSQSRVRFPVTEGDEYRIAIDGFGGGAGAIALNWEISKTVPLTELMRATGLQFTEVAEGVLAVPFSGERADQVVVNAKEMEGGIVLFFVGLPEFTGFGMKAFLQTMLKISYGTDYVKAVRLSENQYALAVEAEASVLTPPVCEGFIRSLVALGDVKNQADLIGPGWNKRRENCNKLQDLHISVDPDRARAEVHAMLAGAALPVDLSVHTSRRVISLIVPMQGMRPGGNKDKLRGLLDLNRDADVAKVGLDSKGHVKLLYEVPQVAPDLVEQASAQLASLQVAVGALVG